MIIAWGMTMPGVPFLYYGNEIGMRQLEGLPQIEAAINRAPAPARPCNGPKERTSAFRPLNLQSLPAVDSASDAPNVGAEEKDPTHC